MSGQKISVALDADNLLWLQSQAITSGNRNLSDTLNAMLARLRSGPSGEPASEQHFEATARINESDPELRQADAAIRKLFARSLERTAKSLQRPAAEPR